MLKATVESISKKAIIVTAGKATHTLTGAAVEALAPGLALGDVVEFDSAEKLTTVRKLPKAAAAPAPVVQGKSPVSRLSGSMKQDF